MANTKISALTANTNPNGNEEFVYAYNNANGKISLNTMKTFAAADSQPTLVSGVNIKTINNTSILGSGNIDVSGGGGGGWSPTELGGDANIWELSDGVYETTYNLYYASGSAVPTTGSSSYVRKQMLFITTNSNNVRGYFVFSVSSGSTTKLGYASYGYSNSSSDGDCYQLGRRDWALTQYDVYNISTAIDALGVFINQQLNDANGNQELRVSPSNGLYSGVVYTVYVDSVASGQNYSITLGTGVTNPFNITLPSNSTKQCIVTLFANSATTAIVTGCTIVN